MKHKDIVRFTIDLPLEQHSYLKVLSAKRGVSMRQYVIEAISERIESQQDKHLDLSENKFKKVLEKRNA